MSISAATTALVSATIPPTTFEVIMTFDTSEQQFVEVKTSKPMDELSEKDIVAAILSSLDNTEAGGLVKISLYQTDAGPSPGWLMPRNGKFFFNPDVNSDADTIAWDKYRNDYIAARKKHSAAP